MTPVIEGLNYPIKPEDIDTSKPFMEAFDHTETESSARWVVRFCQEKESWGPFREEELQTFYNRTYPESRFHFNRLIEPGMTYESRGSLLRGGGWLVRDGTNLRVTHDFITRCFRASPAKRTA
jgi:hypothetical protein